MSIDFYLLPIFPEAFKISNGCIYFIFKAMSRNKFWTLKHKNTTNADKCLYPLIFNSFIHILYKWYCEHFLFKFYYCICGEVTHYSNFFSFRTLLNSFNVLNLYCCNSKCSFNTYLKVFLFLSLKKVLIYPT